MSVPFFSFDESFQILYRNESTNTPVGPHTHNALEIYYTLTDLPNVLINDKVTSVSKGSLVIIPPYCIHQLFNQCNLLYERYIITLNHLWMEQVFKYNSSLIPYAHHYDKPAIIQLDTLQQQRLEKKLQIFLKQDQARTIRTYANFFFFLENLNELIVSKYLENNWDKQSTTKSQKLVNQMISYINSHILDSLSVASLSEHFYMNKDYCARLFKQHTGSTISHYISLQKVQLAQALLNDGMSVKEVQEYMGFSSYAYFYKFYKKMTGKSPSQKNIN